MAPPFAFRCPAIPRGRSAATRMGGSLVSGFALLAACMGGVGCGMALRPRTTLAGVSFPSERALGIHAGQSRGEVASVLGEPLEDRETADGLREWHYFEEFQPSVCTPVLFHLSMKGRPKWVRDVRVTFRGDLVAGVVIANRGGNPVD